MLEFDETEAKKMLYKISLLIRVIFKGTQCSFKKSL